MRKNIQLISIFLCVLLIPSIVKATPETRKIVLDNGLTILVTPMPSSEVVSVYAYVKTGAATEGRFMGAGISHFIEHMLFKGTKQRGVGAIAKEIKSLGGNINASTDLDNTMFTLDLPKEHVSQGIDIIADMLMNSSFDLAEVEKERQVIHGEMRLYYDRPQRRLSVNTFKNVYKQHPYQHPTIGYEKLFDAITRDELYGYYKRNYIPNNMLIAVTGNIDENLILKEITRRFANRSPKPYIQRNIIPEPPQISERYSEDYYQTPLIWFSFAFSGLPFNDPDLYAMDLLSMVLGNSQGSRFYKEIYLKKKLVAGISCTNYTPMDRGIFEIEGTMEKDNLAALRESIFTIINQVKRQGIQKDELEKIKTQAAANFIYGNQTSSSIAYRTLMDEAITGDFQFSKRYVDMMRKVSNDDIKRVANKYLNEPALSVTVIKPQGSKPIAFKNDAQQAQAKVNVHKLSNGVTLLLKEDHTAALVGIQAVLNGGLRVENKENNGISQFFTAVWGKATKSQTHDQIIKSLERRAASLSAYSGYNALGISMQFLSGDIDYGLNLFSDVIKNPVFNDDDIETQRQAILVAIKGQEDEVRTVTFKRAMSLLFQKHPNGMDQIGTKATISRITRSDIEKYYRQYVTPSNLVIAVYGDINAEKVKAALEKSLKGFKGDEVKLPNIEEPPINSPRTDVMTKDKEQAVLAMAYLAPSMHSKDRFAMEIINTSLGAGLSGRLFVKVRDELGKAYTVGSNYMPGVDTGNIVLFCLTTNAKIDSVKEIMLKEIEDLSTHLMSDEEFESVKAYIKGTHQMGLNTVGAQAVHTAFNTLYGLGTDFDAHFNEHVDAVTKEQVKEVARTFLKQNQSVTVKTLGK